MTSYAIEMSSAGGGAVKTSDHAETSLDVAETSLDVAQTSQGAVLTSHVALVTRYGETSLAAVMTPPVAVMRPPADVMVASDAGMTSLAVSGESGIGVMAHVRMTSCETTAGASHLEVVMSCVVVVLLTS